jgi:hypothetical protein
MHDQGLIKECVYVLHSSLSLVKNLDLRDTCSSKQKKARAIVSSYMPAAGT